MRVKKPEKEQGPPKTVFKVKEAAARLRVNRAHIIGFIEEGILHAINVGNGSRNHWRIPIPALERMEKERSSLNPQKS